jgi:hypothetical protein
MAATTFVFSIVDIVKYMYSNILCNAHAIDTYINIVTSEVVCT